MPKSLAILLAIVFFSVTAPSSVNATCSANDANDIEYLIFWPPLPGATPDGLAESIRALPAKFGTTGDGQTRQLGFGAFIPIFVSDESEIAQSIEVMFELAKQTNVAVHFNVDDHIEWDERPDLWNWYEPAKTGYNPNNTKNVEWYDWQGTPNKRRYLTPAGVPSQSPHMCYKSPAVQKEVSRIVSQIVGPALRQEINQLKQENKQYLFAGITVGAEAGIDDYSVVPELSQITSATAPMLVQAAITMVEDNAPHTKVGYCALTNAGYSKANPPADINAALADVNQKFIEFWDELFFGAGIPCSRLYTHVAASPLQDDNNNAPIGIVFNPYARPGWSTYPIGTLANGFQPLYDDLAENGNPAWGGVEANAASPNPTASVPSWEEYLAWHYNHGAKLVGINIGASDQSLMSTLSEVAFSHEALAAYTKFLQGGRLIEK
jgi:hypothetical protein